MTNRQARRHGAVIHSTVDPNRPPPTELRDRTGLKAVNRKGLYDDAMEVEGATMDFVIERPKGEDPEVTFSVDALETVGDAMNVWMATRFTRHFAAGKTGPKKLRATLTIALDDEEAPMTGPRPVLIMDGSHRTAT